MAKSNFLSNMFKNISNGLSDNMPYILAGMGVVGMGTAVGLGIRSTEKALTLIEAKKKELNVEKLDVKETVKTTWKCYVPTASMFVLGAGCVVLSTRESAKRCAAWSTAYQLSEKALLEYQNKVVETIGDKKEKAIKEAVVADKVKEHPLNTSEVIITGTGETLCYESVSGRYFKSDINRIKQIVNELNERLLRENYISLNEFFYELGLKPTKIGNDLGWSSSKGLIEVTFASCLSEDGVPCLAVDYRVAPKYGYSDAY